MKSIFDGEKPLLQRFDKFTYPVAEDLIEIQMKSFWIPEEIPLTRDKLGFKTLSPEHQESFRLNLGFQTLADSVQSRGLEQVLAKRASDAPFEAVFSIWSFFELIHSLSYSYIVRSMFDNPTEFFDSIESNPIITNRLEIEQDYYDLEDRGDIFILLLNILALEGVKFYSSFLLTYAISAANNNDLKGVCDILNLIQNDENIHVGISSSLIRILKDKQDLEDTYKTVKGIFDNVIQQELEYIALVKPRDLGMLNSTDVETFLKYRADKVLASAGFRRLYNVEKNNLTRWFEEISSINNKKSALQETANLSYNVGGVKNDGW